MKALVFAAGLGTRLKPLTDTMPKAMVPVGGKPLLQILLEKLRDSGFGCVGVNVHHFASQIVDCINRNAGFGMDVRVSDETDMLLETGGGMKKAVPLLADSESGEVGGPVLVHNVDILSNVDLKGVYDESSCMIQREECGAILLVSERSTSRYLLFDDDMNLVGWTNVSTGQVKSPYADLNVEACRKMAFSGIQVFNPAMLQMMDSWEGCFSIIDFYLSVCDRIHIKGKVVEGSRILDVGKLDSIVAAEEFLRTYY